MPDRTLKTAIVLMGKVDPSVSKAMATGEKMAATSGNKIGKVFLGATAAVSTAALAASAAAVKSAISYETSLAKVSTIADTSAKSMAQISADTLKLSNSTGLAAAEVNEATYQAISAGVKTEDATKVVGVAAKAAKGGFTDVTTAVDGLTTVLNSYGLAAGDADKIANQMLITQNLGKTTFGELAGSVGKLAPTMNAASIGTDEMFSALAALTANGIQTSEAVSGMKAAVANVIKPTAEASKLAGKLGLDFSATALQSKGLSGFLADVKKKTGGNLDTMAKLFGSVEGLNSVLTLTSNQGMSLLTQSMGEMQTNTTALEDAYNKMASTPAERIAKLKNKLSNLGIQVGEKLLPLAEGAMSLLENVDFDRVFGAISDGLVMAGEFAAPLLSELQELAGKVMPALSAVTSFLGPVLEDAFATVGPLLEDVMKALGGVLDFVTNVFSGDWEAAWESAATVVENVFKGLSNAVAVPLNGLISLLNKGIDGINALKVTVPDWVPIIGGKQYGFNFPHFPQIQAHATGGTFTVPHLAVVGDAPETIVPHGNTPRNRSLLQEAARGVGAPAGGGSTYQIYWSPAIYGNSAQEVKQGILDSEREFEARMDAFLAAKERRAFA